jgi:hypothetical protein
VAATERLAPSIPSAEQAGPPGSYDATGAYNRDAADTTRPLRVKEVLEGPQFVARFHRRLAGGAVGGERRLMLRPPSGAPEDHAVPIVPSNELVDAYGGL